MEFFTAYGIVRAVMDLADILSDAWSAHRKQLIEDIAREVHKQKDEK